MPNIIGNALAERRVSLKMTQRQMGGKMDVSAQHVSDWENGRVLPNDVSLKRIGKGYKIRLNKLVELRLKSQPNITLEVSDSSDQAREFAYALASKWADLTPQQVKRLLKVVE